RLAAPDPLACAALELPGDDGLQEQPPLGGLAGRLLLDLAPLLHPESDGRLERIQARDDSRIAAADAPAPGLEPLVAVHAARRNEHLGHVACHPQNRHNGGSGSIALWARASPKPGLTPFYGRRSWSGSRRPGPGRPRWPP